MDGLFSWLTQSPDNGQMALMVLGGLALLVIAFAISKIGGNVSVGAANVLTSVGKAAESVAIGVQHLAGPFNFWNKAGDALIQEAVNREPVFDLDVKDANGNSLHLVAHGYDVAATVAKNMPSIPHPPTALPAPPPLAQIAAPRKRRGLLH